LSFDIDRVVRTLKPEKRTAALTPRPRADLVAASGAAAKRPVVPDTTVYVHGGQGRLPPHVTAIVQHWPLLHCSVALGEIAHGIGRLDPSHPQTPRRRTYLESVLRQVPQHRVITPDDDVHVSAGVLTGILARLLGLSDGGHRLRVNDVLIFLTARKAGAAVLTANVGDFDLLQQLVPSADVVYYAT
jgi:predicted nucleic acid-binding protein